mmetsp:Transcript_1565/g.1700  ORF Transcript_1565/g.1700 Transcript_1565/m.1700 type:complete len:95 (+) Transcript_1565:1150-1434(+)
MAGMATTKKQQKLQGEDSTPRRAFLLGTKYAGRMRHDFEYGMNFTIYVIQILPLCSATFRGVQTVRFTLQNSIQIRINRCSLQNILVYKNGDSI